MAQDKEEFLSRWSRLKLDAEREAVAREPAPAPPAAAAGKPPELPPLDALDFESDFRAYMHAKVDESLRRAALKKLFADPRFNVMDGLDVYIDDYTKGEAVAEELLARLEHARHTLLGAQAPRPADAAPAQGEADAPGGERPKEAADGVSPAAQTPAGTDGTRG